MKQERKSLIEDQHFPFECSDSYGVESDFQVLHWHQEIGAKQVLSQLS